MQWVGAAILIGLLVLLLIGGTLLAKSEKTLIFPRIYSLDASHKSLSRRALGIFLRSACALISVLLNLIFTGLPSPGNDAI